MDNIFYAVGCCIILVGFTFYLNSDYFNLKCIVSTRDGNKYCVREIGRIEESVDLLALATSRLSKLVHHMNDTYPENQDVKRMFKNFNPKKIMETLPTSEHTAYTEDKGRKMALCLRKKKTEPELIDINTLTFVAIHELSHMMTNTIGHKPEFWTNFKLLLKNAVEIGIYIPINYGKTNQEYCGMSIDDNPFFG